MSDTFTEAIVEWFTDSGLQVAWDMSQGHRTWYCLDVSTQRFFPRADSMVDAFLKAYDILKKESPSV